MMHGQPNIETDSLVCINGSTASRRVHLQFVNTVIRSW